MPELPEVELTRRNLERWLAGRKVVRAEAERKRTFRGTKPELFEETRGSLLAISRKGKYLLLEFEGDKGLLIHLGMTGKLVRRPAGAAEPYSRARVFLDDGQVIHLRDSRLFGRIEATSARGLAHLPAVKKLGRDPLREGLTAKELADALLGSKQDIKVALMNQERLAGLGNLHAAEALFRAGIHPARKPSSLTSAEWKRLASAIHAAIAFALRMESSEELEYVEEPGAENPFFVYGRAGERCLRCKTTLKSFTQGGRTTHYCPRCQPKTPRRR